MRPRCIGTVRAETHCQSINQTTGKSYKKKLGRLFPKKDTEMTKALQFECGAWNVRELGEKEEE